MHTHARTTAALPLQVKAKAKAFANALATIGKFTIRKKVGERDQIYGSVQTSEVGVRGAARGRACTHEGAHTWPTPHGAR